MSRQCSVSNPGWGFEIWLPKVDSNSSRAPSERRQANSRALISLAHNPRRGGHGLLPAVQPEPRLRSIISQPRRATFWWGWTAPARWPPAAASIWSTLATTSPPSSRAWWSRRDGREAASPRCFRLRLLTRLSDSNPERAGNRPAPPNGATRFGRWACLRGPGSPHKKDTPTVCRAGAAIRFW